MSAYAWVILCSFIGPFLLSFDKKVAFFRSWKYLFPSIRTFAKPMSDNTLLAALRRMGFPKEMLVTHGFRAMASTLLNEQGCNRDAIERQLAHGERNKSRAAYNHAEYLPERRKMMQAWADYLDELRMGGKVVQAQFG